MIMRGEGVHLIHGVHWIVVARGITVKCEGGTRPSIMTRELNIGGNIIDMGMIMRATDSHEFYRLMREHHESLVDHPLRKALRQALWIPQEAILAGYGEQPYMLGGRPKVLGKRVLARHLQERFGVMTFEMLVPHDTVRSESGIWSVAVPSFSRKIRRRTGLRRSNVERISESLVVPAYQVIQEDVDLIFADLKQWYRDAGSPHLHGFLSDASRYLYQGNLAALNYGFLRFIEQQAGLGRAMDRQSIDVEIEKTMTATGCFEWILDKWPEICRAAHVVSGGKTQGFGEYDLPFWVIERDLGCRRRVMRTPHDSRYFSWEAEMGLQGVTFSELQEMLSHGTIFVTFRAIPRVLLYSILADGEITGGGSTYNETAEAIAKAAGLPYFPYMHLRKNPLLYRSIILDDENPNRRKRKRAQVAPGFYEEQQEEICAGTFGIIDCILSVGWEKLRAAVDALAARDILTCNDHEDLGTSVYGASGEGT